MRLRYSDEATPVCLYAILHGVYDVGSRADIAAEWALNFKEYRDDSSRACEAGDVGWDSILKNDRHLRCSPAPEHCRAGSSLYMTSHLFKM